MQQRRSLSSSSGRTIGKARGGRVFVFRHGGEIVAEVIPSAPRQPRFCDWLLVASPARKAPERGGKGEGKESGGEEGQKPGRAGLRAYRA